jgi:outer membrane protein TolC
VASSARQQLQGALRQARSEVRTAFQAVREANLGLAAAREAAQLAQQALDLANLAYRSGTITNLDVIGAERRARDAETSSAIAEDALRQARVDLLAASGKFP